MTRKTTQKEIVEHLLRARGDQGIHTFELRQMYIGNPSERVRQLRELGWLIDSIDERFHGEAFGTRYRLIAEPEVPDGRGEGCPPPEHRTHAVVPTAGQCPGERLFTVGKGEFGFHNQEAAA